MEDLITFEFEKEILPPFDENRFRAWLLAVIEEEQRSLAELSYTFCSDDFLLSINRDHLNHDYYTDIITFPYNYEPIESDIYISVDRIAENAESFGVAFIDELARVMVHGVLHMCGYDDHSEADQKTMREQENHYLSKL